MTDLTTVSPDALRRRSVSNLLTMGHCAPAVMQTLLDASAGVMALGVALGEIERSRLRVLRMIGTMAVGGDAFADDLNKFNRTMNLGQQLAKWFSGAFGSTQCRDITGCDFSTTVGVNQYIETDGVARCQRMAQQVAVEVESMIV